MMGMIVAVQKVQRCTNIKNYLYLPPFQSQN